MEYVDTYNPSEEELSRAEGTVLEAVEPEVEAKIDRKLRYAMATLVPRTLEAEPQDRLRVIIRYRPQNTVESLLEAHDIDVARTAAPEAIAAPLRAAQSRMEFIRGVAALEAQPIVQSIQLEGGIPGERLELGDAIAARLTPAQIRAIAKLPNVAGLLADRTIKLELIESTKTIRLSNARESGLVGTGKGIIVAVIDGECDASHPDFGGRVVQKRDYTGEGFGAASNEAASAIHGTHVAGIIAGNGPTYQGIAPEATIWNYKVYASGQIQSPEGFKGAKAIEDAIKDGANVINCSWGVSVHETPRDGTCPWCVVAARAASLGVVLVKSAGNNGPGAGTTTCPANAKGDVIVVGGSLHTSGQVMERSSRGPTGDGRQKPDILAPGELISAAAPGGGYRKLSGTSMASPHVAGIAALMLERKPQLKPAEIRRILMESAAQATPGADPNVYGRGLIDVAAAIQRVQTAPPAPIPSVRETTLTQPPQPPSPSMGETAPTPPPKPSITIKEMTCTSRVLVSGQPMTFTGTLTALGAPGLGEQPAPGGAAPAGTEAEPGFETMPAAGGQPAPGGVAPRYATEPGLRTAPPLRTGVEASIPRRATPGLEAEAPRPLAVPARQTTTPPVIRAQPRPEMQPPAGAQPGFGDTAVPRPRKQPAPEGAVAPTRLEGQPSAETAAPMGGGAWPGFQP